MHKIIFVNRFFYPDHSATSQILTDLLFNLEVDDAELHVITSGLLYEGEGEFLLCNEVINGVHVHRVWTTKFGRKGLIGRAIDYLSFYIFAFIKMVGLTNAGDILVAKTDPPIISVLAAVVVKLKKATLVNWLQDLFPEVAKGLNVKGLSGGPFYLLVKSLRNWSLKVADKNIVIGEIMADLVNKEVNQKNKIIVNYNWVVGKKIKPVNKEDNMLRKEWKVADKFVVGYSGNLGRAHDYKTIFESVKVLKDNTNIRFIFIGSGAGMDKLKELVKIEKLKNIDFKPYQPIEVLSDSLSVPDVHLLTLEPSMEGLIVPSKIYGILAVGRPIIFIGSKQGEFSIMLSDDDCGDVVEIGDSSSLVSAINDLSAQKGAYRKKATTSLSLYQNKYQHGLSIQRWKGILNDLRN